MDLFELPQNNKTVDVLPKYCKSSVLASLLDLSKQRISNLKTQGIFATDGKDRYNIQESTRAYIKFLRTSGRSKKVELDEAKLEKIKRENRVAENELILVDTACQIAMELASIFKQHVDGFGARYCADLSNMSDTAEIMEFLNEATRTITLDIYRAVEDSEINQTVPENPKTS